MSTKIHAVVDGLGNPTGFQVSEGQVSDLEGADMLLADLEAEVVIADKGYDADERVIEPLQTKGVTVVIPPRCNRKEQGEYDKELYKARHLVENLLGAIYRGTSVMYLTKMIHPKELSVHLGRSGQT